MVGILIKRIVYNCTKNFQDTDISTSIKLQMLDIEPGGIKVIPTSILMDGSFKYVLGRKKREN